MALQIDPNYVTAWKNKGISLKKLGRYWEAIEAFDSALRLDKEDPKTGRIKGQLSYL
jgi:tetratricopeptide (TPR) repeat protein